MLRRARRLLVGSVLGGIVVVLEGRRRSAVAAADALAAFESAPCFSDQE